MQDLLQDDVGKHLRQVSYADQSPAMGALVKVMPMLCCKAQSSPSMDSGSFLDMRAVRVCSESGDTVDQLGVVCLQLSCRRGAPFPLLHHPNAPRLLRGLAGSACGKRRQIPLCQCRRSALR
jgi:hypothetical protein